MTAGRSLAGSPLHRLVRWGLTFACLAMGGQALAEQVAVVLSEDSAPYQEVYQVVRAHLAERGHAVQQAYAVGLAAAALSKSRLTVAVGVRAAESLAVQPLRTPVLAVLVPQSWYVGGGRNRLSDSGRRIASAIFLDQPPERQAHLVRLAFPDAQRVGVLTGAGQPLLLNELDDALRTQRLGLVWQELQPDTRLIGPLEQILASADLLLAVPDPQVFNRNTAQSLFLTSYRYRVPVLGYSRSLTRAGALLSLHSSPAQIGRQAGEWINQALAAGSLRLPLPAHPAYFDVSINEQVARSLGFVLPPESVLEKQLGGGR